VSIASLFSLEGKTALITGGSRGLGLQLAEALGDAGARLVVSARKPDELEHAVEHLAKRGLDASWVQANVAEPDDARRLAKTALERLGRIDVLVNNAGASWGVPAEEHPLEAWDKVMNLNVRGVFVLSQAVGVGSMIPNRSGSILNIASIAGLRGNAPDEMQTLAYNTSKAAVINLTRALAGEWGRYGIRVNALAPGFFPSRMTRGLLDQLGEDKVIGRAPLRRLGDDQDLKGAALLFASDAGKHITGQTLAVDGGVSAIL